MHLTFSDHPGLPMSGQALSTPLLPVRQLMLVKKKKNGNDATGTEGAVKSCSLTRVHVFIIYCS